MNLYSDDSSSLASLLRAALRRTVRGLLPLLPDRARLRFARLPYTRFHSLVPKLFGGRDQVDLYGASFEMDVSEDMAVFHPLFFGEYEAPLSDLLLRLGRDASCYADVGANVGLTTLPAAVRNPQLRVFAFEPDEEVRQILWANLRANPGAEGRVEVCAVAASDREGEARFARSFGTGPTTLGRLLGDDERGEDISTVRTVRLDRYFEGMQQRPDLVKIDVEGHELSVLRGMSGLFSAGFPRWIVLEMHPALAAAREGPGFTAAIVSLLAGGGYEIEVIGDEGLKPFRLEEELPGRFHLLASRRGESAAPTIA
jgi:FkbM family methyltransferase